MAHVTEITGYFKLFNRCLAQNSFLSLELDFDKEVKLNGRTGGTKIGPV